MAELEVKVRGDVPMNMHPAVIRPGAPDPVTAVATEALGIMYETYGTIEDAYRALVETADGERYQPGEVSKGIRHVDQGLRVVTGHEGDFVEAVTAAFERVAPRVDVRLAEMEKNRARIAAKVEEALGKPDDLAPEIRAHVRSIRGNAQQLKFLNDRIVAKDVRTVAAVLSAPPYLSGLTAANHETARNAAEANLAPDDYRQLKATEAAIEAVRLASSRFVERYGEAMSLAPTAKPDHRSKALLGRLRSGG
jgi:hypothetical protein